MSPARAVRSWGPDELIGGALCLDFTNTVGGTRGERAPDHLQCHADLVAWARAAAAIGEVEAAAVTRRAQREPLEASLLLNRALALREAMYRLFSATAAGEPVLQDDLGCLNEHLRCCHRLLELAPAEAGFAWCWRGEADHPERVLWPVLHSAAALLTGSELARLRQCARCSWLFLDRSRNKRRRWCRMETCGNRAKSQRHYRRVTGRAAPGPDA